MTTYTIFVALAMILGIVLIVFVPNLIGAGLGWGLVLVAVLGIFTILDHKGRKHDDTEKI